MFSARRHAVSCAVSRAAPSRRFLSIKTAESGLGASELSLIVPAGARYEPVPGVAHLLQNAAFRDTAARSGLRLQREAELLGGSVSATLSQEHLVLTARFLREDLPYFVNALADTATKPLFREYQFAEEIVPLSQAQAARARADPAYRAVESAYETAFRSGLGNPLLVSPESPVSLAQLKEYAHEAYALPNAQLFARNVSESDLAQFAGPAFAGPSPAASRSASAPKFYSGESRVKSAASEQVAVLAFPTAPKPCLAALKYVLGGKSLKWSTGFGLLHQRLPHVEVRVHNATFSDASLFYITLRGSSAAAVGEAARTAAATLQSVAKSVDETLAKKAIAKARFAQVNQHDTIAPLLKGSPDLSKVSAKSIAAAAKSLCEGPRVLSVVGKTHALPYADELF